MKSKFLMGAGAAMLATGAFAANPTVESGSTAIPLTIEGFIDEVVACTFEGDGASQLTFNFGDQGTADPGEDQYTQDGTESLTINCANGADGAEYAIAMTTDDGSGDESSFGQDSERSANVAVTVGGEELAAILRASEDAGDNFQPVDQDFSNIGAGDTQDYVYQLAIQDPNGASGEVAAANDPQLFVRFDNADAEEAGDGFPLEGVGPLGGADAPVVDGLNTALNTVGDNDPTPITETAYPQVNEANRAVNDALAGGGGGGGIPVAPLDGTPAEPVPEEQALGALDQNGDGQLSPADAEEAGLPPEPPGGGGGIPVAPLDGTPLEDVPEEAALENFDTNDDGELNEGDAPA